MILLYVVLLKTAEIYSYFLVQVEEVHNNDSSEDDNELIQEYDESVLYEREERARCRGYKK